MEIRRFNKETDSFTTIVELFKTGLGETDEHFWERKYLYNSGFDEQVMYVIEDNSEIVAMMGFVPQDYMDKDRRIHKFIQPGDLVIRPDHRGRGLLYEIVNYTQNDLCKCGYEAFLGFPNSNSVHGFRKMNYKIVDLVEYPVSVNYVKLILHKISLGSKYINKSNYDFDVMSSDFGNAVCELKKSKEDTITDNCIKLDINPTYLKWRCNEYEGEKYKAVTVRDKDKLIAYFIILVTRGRLVTAAKIVNFDIDKKYICDIDNIAQELKKAIYTFADSMDFYGIWNQEIEKTVVKAFGIKNKNIKNKGALAIKMLGNRQMPTDDLFINHIDTDL